MTYVRVLTVLVLIVLPLRGTVLAQNGRLEIVAVGGFLGHVESFCEQPGGIYDLTLKGAIRCDPNQKDQWPAWLGGVVGVDKWFADLPENPSRLVLLSGNNAPALFQPIPELRYATPRARLMQNVDAQRARATEFWQEIDKLRPNAIALGPDDFFRGLRRVGVSSTPAAAEFVRRLRERSDTRPFIASNAVVTLHGKTLNTVKDGRYELLIDAATSIAWDAPVAVEHPCNSPVFFLNDVIVRAKAGKCVDGRIRSELQIERGMLTPGAKYELRVKAANERARLTLRTHQALTPYPNNKIDLDRLPVIWRRIAGNLDVAVIGLVDTATKSAAGTIAWTWKGESCSAESCTVDILDPVATLKLLRKAIDYHNGHRRQAFILLSELSDEDTKSVLEEIPEIRVVILSSGSVVLGRQVADSENEILPGRPPSSGDLGAAADINSNEPTTRRVAVRPEWFGETGARVVTRWRRESSYDEIELDVDTLTVDTIIGYPFRSVPVLSPDPAVLPDVSYVSEARDGPVALGQFVGYTRCTAETTDHRCEAFRGLWSKDTFNAIAADAVQRRAKTDLVILPDDVIDADVAAWLERTLVADRNAHWLSRFILDRVVYRSYRIVRASVEGSKLLDTLQKIAAQESAFGERYCLSGIGRTECGASAIDNASLVKFRVNDRIVDARAFYTIAMPDQLATTLQLRYPEEADAFIDVEEAVNDALQSGDWYVAPGPQTKLPTDVDKLLEAITARAAEKRLGYWLVPTLDGGYSRTAVGDFKNRTAAPKVVPSEVGGAKEASSISLAFDSDFSPYDTNDRALRFVTSINYTRKETEQIDSITAKRLIRSYDKNEIVAGLRHDWKYGSSWEWRPYGGVFIDGPFLRQVEDLTAKTMVPQTTTFVVEPNQFVHGRVGIDALANQPGWTKGKTTITLTKAGAAFNVGRVLALPVSLTLAGERREIDELSDKGAQALLDEYVKTHPEFVPNEKSFVVETERRGQRRADADLQFTIAHKLPERSYTGEVGLQYRRYWIENIPPLGLEATGKVTLKGTFPAWSRMQLVVKYEWQFAKVNASDDDDLFKLSKFEFTLNFPFQFRWGNGTLRR